MTLSSAMPDAPVASPGPRPVPFPEIAFVKHRLANGLTLIVHEDRSTPLIAAELRYNVGSKDEPPGRFGFAHLFEHLMFKESANRRGNWHTKIAEVGGSNVNGTTSYDRTTYFQTVPSGAIDTLLWMESDRMGHLLDGLSAEALAAEIDVVKNEKREREGAPLGGLAEIIAGVLYPFGHPYGHTIIGTFEDLDNATLETARDWYRRWYGAANAILVLAGDIAPDEALAKVEHWFGDLPIGEPIRRATRWLPPRQGSQRLLVHDRVSNPGVVKVWIVPAYGEADTVDLGLLATALTGTPAAVLTRRLVEEERLCTAVQATVEPRYLCSEFCISATFAPGADGARVEAIIDAELRAMIADGPDAEDLAQAFRAARLGLIKRQGSLAVRAELLAASEMTFGTPDGFRRIDAVCAAATPARVAAAGRRWLAQDSLTIDVRPHVERRGTSFAPDRATAPSPRPVATPRFPIVQRAVLTNGIGIHLTRRPNSAMVATLLLIEGGSAGDPIGHEGYSAFTAAQMMAGTRTQDKRMLHALQRDLGARIKTNASLDTSSARCDSLRDCYPDAVRLMADLTLRPSFPETELARAREAALAAFDTEILTPAAAVQRAAAALTFGEDHMLARRHGGTRDSIADLTSAHVRARYAELFRPAAATLFVVGDLTMDQAIEPLEQAFGGWQTPGRASAIMEGAFAPRPGRYLVPSSGAAQSVIHGAIALPAFGRDHLIGPAMGVFSHIFGGSFGSRLNRNLREERGWTYGAHSRFARWRTLGSFTVNTLVQADRTVDALSQIETELAGLAASRPITQQEVERAKNALLLEMPSYWTTDDAILEALVDSHRHGQADDHYDRLGERLSAVSVDEVRRIADLVSDPAAMSFVVAGDPAAFDHAGLTRVSHDGRCCEPD